VDATNRNTALASAMVEELARCGVRHAAIAPGSRSSPLALALLRAPAIETTTVVDERSAGFFALGAALATGMPSVVACTSGTAAANLHPAVCEADQADVPMLVCTSDRPPELRDVGAGQTIDQLKLYGEAVRWFCEAGTHEADDDGLLHLRSVACRAFAAARGDRRPGPVHLNLAWRDPLGPEPREGDVTATAPLALEGRGERPLHVVISPVATVDEHLLEELCERLATTPRGLIVAGRQPDRTTVESIAALASAAGYPILAEPTSQLRLGPHDRDLVVANYEPIARARPTVLTPKLVLRFGDMPTCKPLRGWLAELDAARQIVVDPHGGWNEPSRRAETMLRADPATLAAGAADRLSAPGDPGWASSWLDASNASAEAIDSALASQDELTEPAVHAALGNTYRDGDLVYTASSMPIRDQEAFMRTGPAEVRFLSNRGANGIDGLLSSGIGAAAATGRPTWIVTGDLGLFHDMNALALHRQVSSPVRIVVLDNGGGGIFEFLPQAEQVTREEFEAIFGTPVGLRLDCIADLYELPHRRVQTLDDIAAAAADGTCLIEVPVADRRRNVEVHRQITDAAEQAVLSAVA
jgi:2-succinyl-5-enolpyruvyl-6-hydroxy-3-cyclohexene-1-carboxylate synthase